MVNATVFSIIIDRSFHINPTMTQPAMPTAVTYKLIGNTFCAFNNMPTISMIDDTHLIYQSLVCVGVTFIHSFSV